MKEAIERMNFIFRGIGMIILVGEIVISGSFVG